MLETLSPSNERVLPKTSPSEANSNISNQSGCPWFFEKKSMQNKLVRFFFNPWISLWSLWCQCEQRLKKYPHMTFHIETVSKRVSFRNPDFHDLWHAHKRQFSHPYMTATNAAPLGNGVPSLAHWKNPSSCDSMFCTKSVGITWGYAYGVPFATNLLLWKIFTVHISGEIIVFHQPRFSWNKGIPLP